MLNLTSLLAADPIGKITPPDFIKPGINPDTGELTGIMTLFNSLLRIVFVVAGIWAFFNFIIAGLGFMNAAGDPKKVVLAWERIWKSFLGILIIVCSFLFAAIIGLLFFKDPMAILRPTLGTK